MLATGPLPTSLAEESWYLPSGRLIIHGGGGTVPVPDTTVSEPTTGHDVMKSYIGEQTPVVVIPSALMNPAHASKARERYAAMGFHNVAYLHSHDRAEADTAEFAYDQAKWQIRKTGQRRKHIP